MAHLVSSSVIVNMSKLKLCSSLSMAVKIQMANNNFIVTIFYIPPSLSIIQLNQNWIAVENYIKYIYNEFPKVSAMIAGDFNA